jgi:hypothetical protein
MSWVSSVISRFTGMAVCLGLSSSALLVSTVLAQTEPAKPPADPNVTYANVWTPRTETGRIHLHGGVFAPIDANATSATLGARLGFNIGSHVLLGASGDWTFHTKSLKQNSDSLPGLEPKIVLAKVNAHLIPAMAFIQVKLTDKFPIVPYFGVGAGYEWLILDAKDYRTDRTASRTYANWAWQSYGGLGLALGRDTRLDGELFFNGGSLERDVTDQTGQTWREAVDVKGAGVRVGLDILY